MRTDESAITVRGLVRSYGGKRVVDEVSLEVRTGECFALLGPNGAGKTTTVDILAGLRGRDGGSVEVLGTDPAHADRAWRARVGVVAQSDHGALALTVREMLAHFARYHGDPRPADDLLAAVGLTEQAAQRVPTLSGGQRRRLDVALGVQGRPELLFLDEPTTGFDPAARRQFWSLIESLRDDGTTVLLTTHYLDEAAHLADRVGVLAAGRVVEVAAPEDLGGRLSLEAVVSWEAGGRRHRVATATPTAVLREALAGTSGELAELTVARPSLEDVYLTLLDRGAGA